MEEFLIQFLPKSLTDKHNLIGNIKINDFNEKFKSNLSIWKEKDYKKQWIEAIKMIIDGHSKSYLITDLRDPRNEVITFCWAMYLFQDKVKIQNNIILKENLNKKFDLNNIYDFVPDYKNTTEDGSPISEWLLDIKSLEKFYEKYKMIY